MNVAGDGPGQWHANGRDTERDAAWSVANSTGTLRAKTYALLLVAGDAGLTDDEGGALLDGDRLTFGRRRSELVTLGRVRDSGRRRLTPRGRRAVVWVVDVNDMDRLVSTDRFVNHSAQERP